MFKVGDAVRVKAGVKGAADAWAFDGPYPFTHSLGKKHVVTKASTHVTYTHAAHANGWEGNGPDCINTAFLEPWNDYEEWDGEKWVPKKWTGEITINGVTYVRKVVEQTNAEIAEEILNRSKDEMEMYEFEHDGKVATLRIASVLRTGNIITVVYDASGD